MAVVGSSLGVLAALDGALEVVVRLLQRAHERRELRAHGAEEAVRAHQHLARDAEVREKRAEIGTSELVRLGLEDAGDVLEELLGVRREQLTLAVPLEAAHGGTG